jgi:BlaI family penicillinase repressor
VLEFRKNGKSYLYSPLWTEEQCRKLEAESFLDRVFDGALSPMLAHFVRSRRLGKKELDELERILRENK